ncbi:hypothetical protein HDU93_000686 [Gonapodya sp. JEL0774]|nr:hypothetical protein HDU93_000686 [Gonapodya sp. JEL0774]
MNVAQILGPLESSLSKVDTLVVAGRIEPLASVGMSPDITTPPSYDAALTVASLLERMLERLSFRPEFPFKDLVDSISDLKPKSGLGLGRKLSKLESKMSKRLSRLTGGAKNKGSLDISPIPTMLQLPHGTVLPPQPADLPSNDTLQLAIYWHYRDELVASAYYFSLSACALHPLGLFLYGMCLRHGWGVPQPDETNAFLYFLKSLQVVIRDLESFTPNPDRMRDLRLSERLGEPNALSAQVMSVEEVAHYFRNKPLPPLPGHYSPERTGSPLSHTTPTSLSPGSPDKASPSSGASYSSYAPYSQHAIFAQLSDSLFDIVRYAREVQNHTSNRDWDRNRSAVEDLVRIVQTLALIAREHIDPLVAGAPDHDPSIDVDVEAMLASPSTVNANEAAAVPFLVPPAVIKAIWAHALAEVGRSGRDLVVQSLVLVVPTPNSANAPPISPDASTSTTTLRRLSIQVFLRCVAKLIFSVRRLVLAIQKCIYTIPPPAIVSIDRGDGRFTARPLMKLSTGSPTTPKPMKLRGTSGTHFARSTKDGHRPLVEQFMGSHGRQGGLSGTLTRAVGSLGSPVPAVPAAGSLSSMPSSYAFTPAAITPGSRPLTLQRPDRPPPILTPQNSFPSSVIVAGPTSPSRPATLQRPKSILPTQGSFNSTTQVAASAISPIGASIGNSGAGVGRPSVSSLVTGTLQRIGGTLQRASTTGGGAGGAPRSSPIGRGMDIAAAFSVVSFGTDIAEEREKAVLMANLVLPLALFQMGVSLQQGEPDLIPPSADLLKLRYPCAGWGVPHSSSLAFFLFSASARLGDSDAQEQLGNAYKTGTGARANKLKAALWMRECAVSEAETNGTSGKGAGARGRMLGESWIWKQKWGGPDP